MNREDVIGMARNAGGADIGSHGWISWVGTQSTEFLERFAALVAAAEREACAKFVEEGYVRQFERPWREDLAAAIRARGQA